jgi:hypothetical protein
VVKLEPYGNPLDFPQRFAALETELNALGVVMSFEGRSPYGASYVLFLMSEGTGTGRRARQIQAVAREMFDGPPRQIPHN